MKPSSFEYVRAGSVREVLDCLSGSDGDAKILAGGQSLVPMMNFRMAAPGVLLDINALAELDFIHCNEESISIGALTRHATIEHSAQIARMAPMLSVAARNIGHWPIRTRGTFGGSLAHADPASEWPLMALLLSARIQLESASGTREIAAEDFFDDIFLTALDDEEIVRSVSLRSPLPGQRWGFRWFSRRAGDFSLVHVGTLAALDNSGCVEALRIVIGGVEARPIDISENVAHRLGERPDESWIAAVTNDACATLDPPDDHTASSVYRRELAEVLVNAAVSDAVRVRMQDGGA